MKTVRLLSLSLFAIAAYAPAQAQLSFGDKDEPILVAADKATYKGSLTILEGNVDVRQGGARIRSDKMEIYREKSGEEGTSSLSLGAVTRIVAIGNFSYRTLEDVLTGNTGTYIRKSGTIIVAGNVSVGQPGKSRLSGEKLVYDLKTKRARVGDGEGRVNFGIERD